MAPVQVVINAVQAMANGLDALHKYKCQGKPGVCNEMRPIDRTLLLNYLHNVTYVDAAFRFPVSFNSKQEVDGNYTIFNFRKTKGTSYDYVKVGSWVSKLISGDIVGDLFFNESNVRWMNGSTMRPLSTCRPNCKRNQISILREDTCCHECQSCETMDIVVNNTCKTCAEGYVPNANISSCKKLPLHFVNMNTALAGIITFFACLGIAVDAIVFVIFIKNSENKLIKASGREMCYLMFVGIATIFAVPLTSLSKPTSVRCYIERFVMGMSFTVCYAPLLMKMFRIHRIFKHANQLRRLSQRNMISRQSLVLITTGLVAIQGLFCALVFSSDPPRLIEKYDAKTKELLLECDFKNSTFVIYFMYNGVLIAWCTFYAFRTRQFPKNYNEALYIGITMYLTCVVWVIFFATFLNANNSISRVYWQSSTSLVIGWVTLLGLFVPKIYHLYTKTEIPNDRLLAWGTSTYPAMEGSMDNKGSCRRCLEMDENFKKNDSPIPNVVGAISSS